MLTNFTWNIKQEMFGILFKFKQSVNAPCRKAIKLFMFPGSNTKGILVLVLSFILSFYFKHKTY